MTFILKEANRLAGSGSRRLAHRDRGFTSEKSYLLWHIVSYIKMLKTIADYFFCTYIGTQVDIDCIAV